MALADCKRTEPVSFLEHLTTLQFIIYPYGTVLYTRLFIPEDACKLLIIIIIIIIYFIYSPSNPGLVPRSRVITNRQTFKKHKDAFKRNK